MGCAVSKVGVEQVEDFAAVQPGASKPSAPAPLIEVDHKVARAENDLNGLKCHAKENAARKLALEASMAAHIQRAEQEMFARLEEMRDLRASTTSEWEDYERTTAIGLPSQKETDAALHIQRHGRGAIGRGQAKRLRRENVMMYFKAAAIVQRFIRGQRERKRMRPIIEAAKKDASGMQQIRTQLHKRLPVLAARKFDADFEVDFHGALCKKRKRLLAQFHQAVGIQKSIDLFARLASGRATSRADQGQSVAATRFLWKQRIYEKMAEAATLKASASRYVACKRRLGVIEILKPWVLALPTPAEETEEQMQLRHDNEHTLLQQEHEDLFEEASLGTKDEYEATLTHCETELTATLATLESGGNDLWCSQPLYELLQSASGEGSSDRPRSAMGINSTDLAYCWPLLVENGLARVAMLWTAEAQSSN